MLDAMAGSLWQPSAERVRKAALTRFRERMAAESGAPLPDFAALHRWSVEAPEAFWRAIWTLGEVRGDGPGTVMTGGGPLGTRWFPEARLNFAENLLRRDDAAPALLCRGETDVRREVSFSQLRAEVAAFGAALRGFGIRPGDRVAAYLPNAPEAVVAMLAAASVGATWSSCSPDFGVRGVLDRFGQIEPRVLIACEGYDYNGRHHDTRERAAEIRAALPSVEQMVSVPVDPAGEANSPRRDAHSWRALLDGHAGSALRFERLPFEHPLYILYSSGTTGPPKCIVHGAGGTLLQHLKEQRLHVDLRPGDRLFYFTTLGWMMWNWLVSGLASEATLVLYDGSPAWPDPGALFRMAEQERLSVFGTSAKFLDSVAKSGIVPRESNDLGSLRSMLSTGSPLLPEGFEFVYENIHPDIHLASISGGTDIVSCFVLGDPTAAVFPGEIQVPGLGMDVDVYSDDGQPLAEGKGELVCRNAFPSMPVGFWNDPDGARYRAAYFERFPGVWAQGDFAEWTEHGGMRIHGRSDAVLNPGGVRIGTAEIYRQVERQDEVLEALVIGQDWDGDVRVVLFVQLRDGLRLDAELEAQIRSRIRANATPRHVPARILQVPEIPRTRSGKIVELAVRDVVHGRPVKNREALANPEALEHFAGRRELAS
jgi:acetoacetyl-CoA synthetase